MQRAFKASDMRVRRPQSLKGEALRRVLEMRGMKDEQARSKLFKEILAEHGKEYLEIEDVLSENVGRFIFLSTILNPKNRTAIIPILKEYSQMPGFYVTEEDDGRVRTVCKYAEAMTVPAEQYMALEHRL